MQPDTGPNAPAPATAEQKAQPDAAQVAAAVAAAAEARLAQAIPVGVHTMDAVVYEGKRKFNLALEDDLLDYKHNHVVKIEECISTLIRLFGNVLDHPDEEKYMRIKASSNVFKNTVSNIKGGEHCMIQAGWTTKVVNLEKHWVWEQGEPGSHKHAILYEAHKLLTKALALIHEKAERKRHEVEEKQAAEEARMASVLAALEDDRVSRRIQQTTVTPTP